MSNNSTLTTRKKNWNILLKFKSYIKKIINTYCMLYCLQNKTIRAQRALQKNEEEKEVRRKGIEERKGDINIYKFWKGKKGEQIGQTREQGWTY